MLKTIFFHTNLFKKFKSIFDLEIEIRLKPIWSKFSCSLKSLSLAYDIVCLSFSYGPLLILLMCQIFSTYCVVISPATLCCTHHFVNPIWVYVSSFWSISLDPAPGQSFHLCCLVNLIICPKVSEPENYYRFCLKPVDWKYWNDF